MNLSDAIGFFPQMVLAGFCVIALLLIVISRELDNIRLGQVPRVRTHSPTSTIIRHRPPLKPMTNSSSTEIAQYDMYRLSKHYVFPPVPSPHHMHPSGHRRSRTMSRMMEAGEMSDFIR